MIPDIFSSFDPHIYNNLLPFNTLIILLRSLLILRIQLSFWQTKSRASAPASILYQVIYSQLSRTQTTLLKGIRLIVSSIFILIIIINLLGLLPYMLRSSRHLAFTLTIGLPIWISLVLSRFSKRPKASVAHLLPDGAPTWLNPFLVLIETSRILVRPLTLSFRLAANMSAGHIVLGLVGIYGASSIASLNPTATFFLTATGVGYILFEVAICVIQGYIFCLLLSLYADDHAHR